MPDLLMHTTLNPDDPKDVLTHLVRMTDSVARDINAFLQNPSAFDPVAFFDVVQYSAEDAAQLAEKLTALIPKT